MGDVAPRGIGSDLIFVSLSNLRGPLADGTDIDNGAGPLALPYCCALGDR